MYVCMYVCTYVCSHLGTPLLFSVYKQNTISGGAQTRQINIHMNAVKMLKIQIIAMKCASPYNSIFNSI